MHELSLVQQLVHLVEAQARAANAEQVLIINLRLGEQSHLASESLELLFELLTANSSCASGAKLQITTMPMMFYCEGCACDYAAKPGNYSCPQCQELGVMKDPADQLLLESLEVI